jgi:hypothetical protein
VSGSGGAVLATDDISSVHYQIIKVAFGALDAVTLASAADPFPINVIAALPAGTNNIGDVDILSVIPGTGATNLGKAEDGAHTTGDVGVMGLAVRTDTPTNRSGLDGDYEPLQIAAGRLWASATIDAALPAGTNNIGDIDVLTVPAPLNVTGGGVESGALRVTLANDSTGLVSIDDNGGSLTVDNAALAVTGSGVEATALRVTIATDSTGVLSVDDNAGSLTVDNAALSVTGGGVEATALRVTIATDSTGVLSVDDNGGSLTVDGTVAVSGTVTVDSELPAAGALGDGATNPTTPMIGANAMLFNGTTWDRMRGDITNGLDVDVTRVTGNVTIVQATASSLNAQVVGEVAHDGVDAGNPIKVGFQARTTLPTAVADADRVNAFADKYGRVVSYDLVPRELIVHNRIVLTSTSETTLIATGGANVFRDIVDLTMSNESATEVRVDIRDATGGTVRFSMDLFPDGGGLSKMFRVPLTQAVADNNWTAQLSTGVSSVYITAEAIASQ